MKKDSFQDLTMAHHGQVKADDCRPQRGARSHHMGIQDVAHADQRKNDHFAHHALEPHSRGMGLVSDACRSKVLYGVK